MKNRNEYKVDEQIVITDEDLLSGKYVFGQGCKFTKTIGCSPSGTDTKTPDNQVKVTFDYSGHGLLDMVTSDAGYLHGVDVRKSARKKNYFPKELTVRTTLGCNIQLEDMPLEAQALSYFAAIPDEDMRKKAMQAFLDSNS